MHYRMPGVALKRLVGTIATAVSIKPVDASIGMKDDQSDITFVHARAGRTINTRAAIAAVARAIPERVTRRSSSTRARSRRAPPTRSSAGRSWCTSTGTGSTCTRGST